MEEHVSYLKGAVSTQELVPAAFPSSFFPCSTKLQIVMSHKPPPSPTCESDVEIITSDSTDKDTGLQTVYIIFGSNSWKWQSRDLN